MSVPHGRPQLLRTKTAVVTGASSGIGTVVARELARQGYRVIALGRDPNRCKAALAAIHKTVRDAQIDFLTADLSLMSDVRRAADLIAKLTNRIDLLVNNAGGLYSRRLVTPDGLEATFAGNHLGPFLLTQRLMPLLRVAILTTGQARIVNTASRAHRMVRDMAWNNLQLEKGFTPWRAYAQSKLANILFPRELAEREKDNGIQVSAMNPGIVDTNFPANGGIITRLGWAMMRPFSKSPEQGADTILWLAIDGPQDPSSGYYENRRPAPVTTAAQSAEAARRLWEISEKLIRGNTSLPAPPARHVRDL